ncbi:MAG TPA: pentapeptide repeat-containing protein [Gaiellaceae bacterium]|nr:pentapeptide repeat-containing protein [Gaiellaceae bacterium]
MPKAPLQPYPPDLPAEPEEPDLEAGLRDAIVRDVDWANRRVTRASVLRTELHTVRLTGADLAESTFRDVRFVGCRLDLAAARLSRFERVVFSDCRLEELDLYGSQLKDVVFERCVLREAAISGVKAERVELRGCDLTGLRGAEALRGMRMPWNDVLENAPLFAAVAGIEIVD